MGGGRTFGSAGKVSIASIGNQVVICWRRRNTRISIVLFDQQAGSSAWGRFFCDETLQAQQDGEKDIRLASTMSFHAAAGWVLAQFKLVFHLDMYCNRKEIRIHPLRSASSKAASFPSMASPEHSKIYGVRTSLDEESHGCHLENLVCISVS